MGIDVNATPTTSPEDQEVLRKVYQARMDELSTEQHLHATEAQELRAQIEPLEARRASAQRHADKLLGQMDELKRIAALDGITLQ